MLATLVQQAARTSALRAPLSRRIVGKNTNSTIRAFRLSYTKSQKEKTMPVKTPQELDSYYTSRHQKLGFQESLPFLRVFAPSCETPVFRKRDAVEYIMTFSVLAISKVLSHSMSRMQFLLHSQANL
jgi:hypothetical protein